MYHQNNDPVAHCIKALQSGSNKQSALDKAKLAHSDWMSIESLNREFSSEEIQQALLLRTIVLCTVATVYVWNEEFEKAFALENEFLFSNDLWTEENRQVIEGYLSHLIYQNQFEHLDSIFTEKSFREEFLQIENIYKSVQNKNYKIKGSRLEFVSLANRLNNYCKLLKGYELFKY